jgi:hypothetical protein
MPRGTAGAGPANREASTPSSVEKILKSLPSHGWTAGWVGRRDRALLVISQWAGLSFPRIAALRIDDIRIEEGVATIRIGAGDPITLAMTADCLLCGPCALVRWLHAQDLSTLHSDGRVVASVIARAAPLTAHSPHVCEGRTSGAPDTGGLPVFPEHDRWAPGVDGLPAQPRPTHDLRIPAPGYGRNRYGTGIYAKPDHGRGEPAPAPVDHPTALENRARALMAGLT